MIWIYVDIRLHINMHIYVCIFTRGREWYINKHVYTCAFMRVHVCKLNVGTQSSNNGFDCRKIEDEASVVKVFHVQ